MIRVMLALLVIPLLSILSFHSAYADELSCSTFLVTGYVESENSGTTADGTLTAGKERKLVAVYNTKGIPVFPYGTWLKIKGVPNAQGNLKDLKVRVADTGHLRRTNHLDLLVGTRGEAHTLTGDYETCVINPPKKVAKLA